MPRALLPPLTLCWTALLLVHLSVASASRSHSCREVKTAFQLRQIGPLKWVPETPSTDVDLLVCKHDGPSCCTRKMEESYRVAVVRETVQNIRSYSFELKFLLSGHAAAFQDTYRSLFSFSQGHLSSLFESGYTSISAAVAPHVSTLFSDLSLFIRDASSNISVEAAVHRFYDNLFPLVHTHLISPGAAAAVTDGNNLSDCLRMTRQDVNPFGHHARAMAEELAEALRAARELTRAFSVGEEVMNGTEVAPLTKECTRALVKMQYCPHCRGLTLIRPCGAYCLNVMRGCLASLSELDMHWRRYVAILEDLTLAVAGEHSLELALLRIRGQVNEAILYAQLHGPRLTATVDKVCGQSSVQPTTIKMVPTVTDSPPLSTNQSDPPAMEQLGRLSHLRREFMNYVGRYKAFFAALPEMLCEGEVVRDEFTCWSGDNVVESYTGRVVGNGVHAQRQNPEVRVRGPDHMLTQVKDRLEHFNQEIQESMPGFGHRESWEDLGSGEENSGECDDEDGCQGSGEDTPKIYSTKGTDVVMAPPHEPSVRYSNPGSSNAPLTLPTFTILILTLALQWALN
ncbi:glypican-5 isoform X2 [Colossoma macropomum]|uniref:glypican-5 isoform X2 n=1 Tax=Colossoma macropomum TaxID=42526 RepID=UPI001864C5A7|nr:glypican-5 isoform X2 [Colossoma macropomum]